MDVAEAKRALRRSLGERRRAVPEELREAAGRAVAESLLGLEALREAACVALYAAAPDELPTRPLFEALARAGCRRLLPRIVGRDLEFAAVDSWGELEPGRHGILAPPATASAEPLRDADVVVVPGVAFDPDGQRLGRGGGYYDRALQEPGPLRVGVAFDLQLVARVPADSRDRPVDAIVTESRVVFARGR